MAKKFQGFSADIDRLIEESSEAVYKLLLDFFSTHSNTRSSFQKAVFDTLFFLCRPGWIGEHLPENIKKETYKELLHLGQPIYYSKDETTLRLFSKNAAKTVMAFARNNPTPKASQKFPQIADVTAMVKTELMSSENKKAAVLKTAFQIYNSRKKEKHNFTVPVLDDQNPLRTVLGLPKTKYTELPKNDMRTHILRCTKASASKNEVPLMSLLQKAAPFSPRVLQSVLGLEIYKRFKPVGYFDQQCNVILIEVTSSSDAYELTFRKPELLRLLKTVPGFEKITDIRGTLSKKQKNTD